MSDAYAKLNGKKVKLIIRNNQAFLKKNGFEQQIPMEEIPLLYREYPQIRYKNHIFDIETNFFSHRRIEERLFRVVTVNHDDIERFDGFYKVEPGVWCMDIKMDDIEAYIIKRKAVGPFKGMEIEDEIFDEAHVNEWMAELMDTGVVHYSF